MYQVNQYADVSWDKNDVILPAQQLGLDWSEKQCEDFLAEHEERIADAMTDAAWEYINHELKKEI